MRSLMTDHNHTSPILDDRSTGLFFPKLDPALMPSCNRDFPWLVRVVGVCGCALDADGVAPHPVVPGEDELREYELQKESRSGWNRPSHSV